MKRKAEPVPASLDVRTFGAKGKGITDDTLFIQAAVNSCPAHGRVWIPAGTYPVCGIYLKSHMSLELEKGATLVFCSEKEKLPVLPGRVAGAAEPGCAGADFELGTWEGESAPMYNACINCLFAEEVTIYGEGTVDGNASFDNWWSEERKGSVPHRPRLLFIAHSKRVQVQGITFLNAPSWCIHPYFSEQLTFRDLTIYSPFNAPNTDGLNPESSRHVEITGCHFSVGDDCIAVKSGKREMGLRRKKPCTDITITNCVMENGHGAVTIGSETGAGVYRVLVKDCLFRNTDRGFRLKTRRGRGSLSRVDDIAMVHIRMEGVLTPFSVNCFYFCEPDGRSAYVQNKNALPVDERTPQIGTLLFRDIVCLNAHIAAGLIYGLPEQKIEQLVLSNVQVSFAEEAAEGVPDMLCDIGRMSKGGLLIRHVREVRLQGVSIEGCSGPSIGMEGVDVFDEGEPTSTGKLYV